MDTRAIATHPLMDKELGYIADWSEWKKLWLEETRVDFLHSLLHFGFEVRTESYEEVIERLCLYLDIADGAFYSYTFGKCYYYSEYYRNGCCSRFGILLQDQLDLKYIISQKAFQMLCRHFFKNTAEDQYHVPSWMQLATNPQVFSKLSNFFRLNEEGWIFNLWEAEGHNAEIATKFALELSSFPWTYDDLNSWRKYFWDNEEFFENIKPQMIEILYGLKRLDILLEKKRCKQVDENCEKKLSDLASRSSKNIGEACYLGSQAARVLILLQKIKEEAARREKIAELEEQCRTAKKEIKKLT